MKKLSQNGLAFIKKLEAGINPKKYLTAYWDYKRYAIGYGTSIYPDGKPVQKDDTITIEKADEMLKHQLKTFESAVNSLVKVPINQNQFDSLVSFSFNVGTGALKDSTLLKRINARASEKEIYDQFIRYKYAGGKVVQGLLNRRIEEAKLFLGSSYSTTSKIGTFATILLVVGAFWYLSK